MLNIQDKARPEGIKSVNIPSVVVERGTFDIEISGIIFVDQYGREMKKEDAEAFFAASNTTSFTEHGNPEFNGYKFVVRATYKGEDDIFSVDGTSFDNNATFEILPFTQLLMARKPSQLKKVLQQRQRVVWHSSSTS